MIYEQVNKKRKDVYKKRIFEKHQSYKILYVIYYFYKKKNARENDKECTEYQFVFFTPGLSFSL